MEEYIKKSDAEAALLKLRKGYRSIKEKSTVAGCLLELKDIPPVDVIEVKSADWEVVDKKPLYYVIKCTNCDGWLTLTKGCYDKNLFIYCPKCGAKMRGTIDGSN